MPLMIMLTHSAYPGQTNLVYDEIKPNDEWIKANLKWIL